MSAQLKKGTSARRKRADLTPEESALLSWDGQDMAVLDAALAAGVDIDVRVCGHPVTALHRQVSALRPDAIKALLDRGANPNLPFDGSTVLGHLLSDRMPPIENREALTLSIVGHLLAKGAVVENCRWNNRSPFLFSVKKGWFSVADVLFQHKPVDVSEEYMTDVVSYVCNEYRDGRANLDCLSYLQDKGGLFTSDHLLSALENGYTELFDMILASPKIMVYTEFGVDDSPSIWVVRNKDLVALNKLLARGFKPWNEREVARALVHGEWKEGIDAMRAAGGDDFGKLSRGLAAFGAFNQADEKQLFPGQKPATRQQLFRSTSTAPPSSPPKSPSSPPEGWVYVMSNDCMPGLVKIGFTKRTSEKRANDLTRDLVMTAIPGRFQVEMEIPTDTPEALENVLHILLAPKRAERGEFFYVSPDEVATVAKIAGYEVIVPATGPAAKSKHSGP